MDQAEKIKTSELYGLDYFEDEKCFICPICDNREVFIDKNGNPVCPKGCLDYI